jgi:hypothetical protein
MHVQQLPSVMHLSERLLRASHFPTPSVPDCRRATSHNSYIHKRRPNVKLQKRREEAGEVGSHLLSEQGPLRFSQTCSGRRNYINPPKPLP